MDKAGSYGIQGLGGRFVEKYEGRFDTVVGLSVKLTEELIEKAKQYD
jgi:septum formation protein